jgi:biopolymer transport protein ExbB/TolQ
MDSMLFIIAIFVSIFLGMGVVIITIIIRKIAKEEIKLREEVRKLKDENHNLRWAEQNLLWHREELRKEVIKLLVDHAHFDFMQKKMRNNFSEVGLYKNYQQVMSVSEAWEKAAKKIYNWS